ncbi:MAG: M23 family metallopeptidase [Sphingorhabdus sp.]
MLLAVIQLGVPVLLGAWLWLWPSGNGFVLTLQFAAIVAVMIALWMAGIWTLVPRWSLAVIALFALIAAVRGARRRASALSGWALAQAFVSIALLMVGGLAISEAWRAHQPPPIVSIRLALPLDGDDVVVANGGSKLLLNAHQDTLDLSVPRHRLWFGQSYGVDLVVLRPNGITSNGFRPSDPKRYAIFGRAVHAPCAGQVVTISNGRPDHAVPSVDAKVMEGNHIRIRCGDVEIVLAHLKRGSLKVREGAQVTTGQIIAAVGNSGMSDQPHLHIHAQMPGTADVPFSGQPVAMLLNGRFLARNDRI